MKSIIKLAASVTIVAATLRFPSSWPTDLQYDFDWQELKNEEDPFQTIDYSVV